MEGNWWQTALRAVHGLAVAGLVALGFLWLAQHGLSRELFGLAFGATMLGCALWTS